MRHRVAGNRINMPEARRRAAFRNLMAGVILHEGITTTEARAKAVQAETEQLIATALRGYKVSRAHLREKVQDESVAEQLWTLAGEANFSLDTEVLSNEERLAQNKGPLTPEARRQRERELEARKERLLKLISNRDEAQAALTVARESRALEVHARRTILKHLPDRLVLNKLFSPEFIERYQDRNGGYTRITKLGARKGDAAEMVRFELVEELVSEKRSPKKKRS